MRRLARHLEDANHNSRTKELLTQNPHVPVQRLRVHVQKVRVHAQNAGVQLQNGRVHVQSGRVLSVVKSVAAGPPDVRKGYAFPDHLQISWRLCLTQDLRRSLTNN